MTRRRPAGLPFAPPALKTELAWRSVNGWARLAQILKGWPNIEPFTAVIRMTLPACADATVPTFALGTVALTPNSDFYIFATSAGGWVGDGHAFGQPQGLPSASSVGNLSDIKPDDFFALVDLYEESGGNRWSNVPVFLPSIFGNGQMPYLWPAPFIVRGGSNLTARVTNRAAIPGLDVELFLCFHGLRVLTTTPDLPVDMMMHPALIDVMREYRRLGKLGRVEPFVYGLNLGLGRGAVAFQTEQVSETISDADFVAVDFNAFTWGQHGDEESTETLSNTEMESDRTIHEAWSRDTVRLSINSGQSKLDTQPVDLASMGGTGRRPYHLAKPLVIPAGADLTAIIGDPGGEDPTVVQARDKFLTFIGVRIFEDERR